MAQQNVTVTGSGATTRIPTDPAVSGGKLSTDPTVALSGGLKQIPTDPTQAAAEVSAGHIKVNY